MLEIELRQKKYMSGWLVIVIMGLVWLLALLYGSGIGQAYDVYGKAKLLTIVIFLFQMLIGKYKGFSKQFGIVLLVILISNALTWVFYGKTMFDYLWLYLLIFLISELPVEEWALRVVSWMYGFLGMAVLLLRYFGSVFNGWNENSLAMIAFFSFAVMISSFSKTEKWGVLLILVAYYVAYYILSDPLNSRSGVLFTVIMMLGLFHIIPFKKWFQKRGVLTLLLLGPLLVAIVVTLLKGSDIVRRMEIWSYTTFNKTLFNGRDVIFQRGFQRWLRHPIIGIGDLSANNWHNSAVAVLVGGGIVGFLFWLFGTKWILEKAVPFLKDNFVFGLMLGFIMIWLQQSVELGLVAAKANAIPYAMLGLLMGRVNTLRRRENEAFDHYSGL